MAWTQEQQRVIDERGSSILVSAAAGSGKTAVLVERILRQVLDEEHPCDIDEFLVVTFTNAAAAQMRDKIAAKLEQALEEKPESEHLMRQLLLVNRADITTIDSFCLKLVKEHFSLLNLDSAFAIGDPGMMELLKSDVLEELFDAKFQAEDNKIFTNLMDIFGSGYDDGKLRDIVLQIYHMASTYPLPSRWIAGAKEALMIDSEAKLEQTGWMEQLRKMIHIKAREALEFVEQGKHICGLPGGPDKNGAVAVEDETMIQEILCAEDYRSIYAAMQTPWRRLAVCRGDKYDKELVEKFKDIRNEYKAIINSISICKIPLEDVLNQIGEMRQYLIPLLELVEEFMEAFAEKKKNRKLMEFSDVEHMAYQLVCGGYDAEGKAVPTEVGRDIAGRYREIFIDEYQDSNFLQEDILCSISGVYRGDYNMFMVGDVKQSIYRFRMARPDLFIEKYNRFSDSGQEVKIELKNNFRSRDVVLQAVNYFFYQIIGEDLGGIRYDEHVALVPTKEFPVGENLNLSDKTEIMIVDCNTEAYEEENPDKLVLEAEMIAGRIKELVDVNTGLDIYDEDEQRYRRAEYRDIVILARSVKGLGESMYNTLTAHGIPVYLDDPKGYFNAVEIKTILSLLAVVDNSRQDIPLAAVLLSPMANITENELAVICDYAEKQLAHSTLLYDKCLCYEMEHQDGISEKLGRFFDIVDELKQDKTVMSISALIWKAIQMTGYYTYAMTMPMGAKRKANIDMLLEKAHSFENGYYKGLFHFLRYVEKLKINEVDFSEAHVLGDGENVVRILSMHKSKGLEYPIVFVSGLGKQFNQNDSKDSLILHSDYYLASMVMDRAHRFRKKSFMRECFRLLIKQENMAEEQRILYVAMTRAKEKLILTGGLSDVNQVMEKYASLASCEDILLPYGIRQDAKSFMHLIIAAMVRYDTLGNHLQAENIISWKIAGRETLHMKAVETAAHQGYTMETIKQMAKQTAKGDAYRRYEENFAYRYPYEALTSIRSKMSISDIKKMKAYDGQGYDIDTEFAVADIQEDREIVSVDGTHTGLTGAERGTIVHKFMELLPFEELSGGADYRSFVRSFKNTLRERNIFDDRELSAINDSKICGMLDSHLGQRMIQAACRKELYKEQQFSIGIPAVQIYNEEQSQLPDVDDIVIVQGIVDAFFYENGQIVLMDYKTDRADEETLLGRYRAQLDYYADTLRKLTGCPVKEKIMYSFFMNREIELRDEI